MKEFNLEEELKKLPEQPGVYLMHDASDEIIYVGKAINLKNRVRQYFQTVRNRSPKIEKMITLIRYFEYIITDSELEALVLENNLIKEYAPKYNTMLTDDKTYPFIKVTVSEPYPRLLLTRQMKRDGAKYFGPFTSAGAVRDTIDLLQKLYHIRQCNKKLPKEQGIGRPCLYYQMKQCPAPCQNYISEEAYRESVQGVLDFLNGNTKQVVQELEEKMRQAAEKFEYEQAAEYRDLIESIRHITGKQRITNPNSTTIDRDVVAMAVENGEAVVSIFFIRDGKLLGREHFHMTGVEEEQPSETMTAFVKQYYAGTPYVPKELLLESEVEERELLEHWLSQKKEQRVHILIPQKGEKHKLIELAKENAKLVLHQDLEKLQREEARTIGAAQEIADLIGIEKAQRIEAYDISNISGVNTVASMVVFEQGKAKRSDYRKFRLRTISGPDDYRSMEETLTRRFRHGQEEQRQMREDGMAEELGSFNRFPDVIMMDGGRGQVNVALQVLEKLHLNIPVCGMVKDDNHRTRGLYYQNQEILFPPKNEAFDLITRIQDEAHRFAIEYHKLLRGKQQVKSVLDDIPGIGPTRRKALLQSMKTIEVIRNASVEELMKIPGMNQPSAQAVYLHFHEKAEEKEN
mgnify:FL=1